MGTSTARHDPRLCDLLRLRILVWHHGHHASHRRTARKLVHSVPSSEDLSGIEPPPRLSTQVLKSLFTIASSQSPAQQHPVSPPLIAVSLGGGSREYLTHCMGAVLGGALFGNICSPISDTTILTVLATKCDLQAHVRTIGPYSLLVAFLAIALGSLPVALGLYGPFSALAVCTVAMWAVLKVVGK